MPLLMIRNDITKMQVDAIVNPANRELRQGRGTSWAIYTVAGEKELAEACRKIGGCEVGNSVLTEGFSLPAKYIIHAVCPPWTGSGAEEKELLKCAYRSALQLAAEHDLRSVAFPLLSSGFYGWPKADAFHTATMVISEFLVEKDMTVYLVLYDHESVEVSKKLFSEIEEYIDDHYVEKHYRNFSVPSPKPSEKESVSYNGMEKGANMLRGQARTFPLPPPAAAQAAVSQKETALPKQVKKNAKKIELPDFLKKLSSAKGRKLDELILHMDETFSQMLLRLIDERGLKDSTVYHKANIDRRLFSKIRKDANYVPTKKTVLAFAIALELTLDETKDLLMKAGFALSNSSKFDVIISFFIENRRYNVFEINEVLFAYGQTILGE